MHYFPKILLFLLTLTFIGIAIRLTLSDKRGFRNAQSISFNNISNISNSSNHTISNTLNSSLTQIENSLNSSALNPQGMNNTHSNVNSNTKN